MEISKLRAWWWHRQGLDGALVGATPAAVLAASGWARSVGGVGPYLTLWARAGLGRAAVDAAVAARAVLELPSARGCTYVVPAEDHALALAVAAPFGGAEEKTAAKLGVTAREVDKLCDAVLAALARAPLDPDAIREAVGGAARSLGEAGKKKGISTTLPVALGRLQTAGAIRRIATNGRLDQQRYQYVTWPEGPALRRQLEPGEAMQQLARRYFGWIGPATLAQFRWFSGLGVKAAAEAVASLGLVPVEAGSELLLLPDDRDRLARWKAPAKPRYNLVSSLDGMALLRRDLPSLVDAADGERAVIVDDEAQPLGGLSNLPSHAILDRGRLVGLWEFDVEDGSIAWRAFGAKDKALATTVAETEAFVRDQLGDARSFSLDSPKSRAKRVAGLRAG